MTASCKIIFAAQRKRGNRIRVETFSQGRWAGGLFGCGQRGVFAWREVMPDRLADSISLSGLNVVGIQDNRKTLTIEALEASNFELRNQITRLILHNTTLRRMLEKQEGAGVELVE